MSGTREYNSPLREAQAEQTRGLILDALAELVADEGYEGVSIKEVARRSGVAERTIYRHFPDRVALQDALVDRLSRSHGWTDRVCALVRDLDDLPAMIERAYVLMDEEREDTRVAAKALAASSHSAPSSLERGRFFGRLVDEGLPDVPAEDRRVLTGVLHVLGSSRTWLRLEDDFGISGAEAGRFMHWLSRLAITELRATGGIPDA